MSVLQRVVKPTTRKGKKVLLKREPQVLEGPKRALIFQGRKTSEKIRRFLKDMHAIKNPDSTMLTKKNDVTIFENANPVELMCKKHEAPLFLMGSQSKKRPDNLVFGRMYNYSLLDMVETYVESYEGLKDFAASKVTMGTKPCLLFNGPQWEQSPELKCLKSLFTDFFHREHTDSVRLQGLEHVLSFNATSENKVLLRSYKILLKKSGCRTPRIELEEIGPRVDLSLRRSKLPTEDLMKEACRKPRELKVTKKKNISRDELGNTHGRIHMGKQEIQTIQVRKMKGLKKTPAEKLAARAAKKAKAMKENQQDAVTA